MKEREDIQQQALEEAVRYQRSGLHMSLGSGKTKVGLDYINWFYTDRTRVLILAPKLSIFETWKHEVQKFNYTYLLDHIEFSTYLSIDKHSPDDYDIVICDEAHNLIKDTNGQWFKNYKGRVLGLSGTMPKYHHSDKGQIVDEVCPVVFTYTTDDAVIDNIVNDYRIITHPLVLSTTKDLWVESKRGRGWYTSEEKNYQYWSTRVDNARSKKEQQIMRIMRMKALMRFTSKEVYAKKLFDSIEEKAILFANEQEQVDRMCSFTYHSNNPDSEENLELFKTGKINKLGAIQMLSEGVNIPGLRQAVIMHSYSGSSPKTQQKLGRILRLNPDDVAVLHVLYYQHTIDSTWMNSVLESFDQDKIMETN